MTTWSEELNLWFLNQNPHKNITELAKELEIPRATFQSYLKGSVELSRVNPDNLAKLYSLTNIEHFNSAAARNLACFSS